MHGDDSSITSACPRHPQFLDLVSQLITHWKYSLAFWLAPDSYFAMVVDQHALGNAVTGTLLSLDEVDTSKGYGVIRSYLQSLLVRVTAAEPNDQETHSLFGDVQDVVEWFSAAHVVLCADPKAILDQAITCNKKLLRQAFAILLSNAIEASYRTPVIVKVLEYQNYTTVIINDSGKGMSRLDKIRCTWFGWSNKQSGQGLGLGAAKWILTKYCRAELTICSNLGVGTTVICVFPR